MVWWCGVVWCAGAVLMVIMVVGSGGINGDHGGW